MKRLYFICRTRGSIFSGPVVPRRTYLALTISISRASPSLSALPVDLAGRRSHLQASRISSIPRSFLYVLLRFIYPLFFYSVFSALGSRWCFFVSRFSCLISSGRVQARVHFDTTARRASAGLSSRDTYPAPLRADEAPNESGFPTELATNNLFRSYTFTSRPGGCSFFFLLPLVASRSRSPSPATKQFSDAKNRPSPVSIVSRANGPAANPILYSDVRPEGVPPSDRANHRSQIVSPNDTHENPSPSLPTLSSLTSVDSISLFRQRGTINTGRSRRPVVRPSRFRICGFSPRPRPGPFYLDNLGREENNRESYRESSTGSSRALQRKREETMLKPRRNGGSLRSAAVGEAA